MIVRNGTIYYINARRAYHNTDRTTTSHTVSEDISDADQYVTKAEDTLFEIIRYLENHPADVNGSLCLSPRPCHPALEATRYPFVP